LTPQSVPLAAVCAPESATRIEPDTATSATAIGDARVPAIASASNFLFIYELSSRKKFKVPFVQKHEEFESLWVKLQQLLRNSAYHPIIVVKKQQ
jgi:hypothetical protein